MGKTVPNQKTIIIHKKKYLKNFLQIGLDEIQEVVSKYNKSTIALYLYLAGNADNYNLALSQVAFENAYGIKKTAYYDAIEVLTRDGYLVKEKGNVYSFYTTPFSAKTETNSDLKQEIPFLRKSLFGNAEENFRKNDIEIDNRYNKQIEGNINTLSEANASTSHVNITAEEKPTEGEKALPITKEQLAQVINYEDCGNGKYLINGRYFYLQN